MKNNNLNNTLTFETAIEELELLIDKIDNNDISLKDMMNIFERGTELVDYCNKELTVVEKKILQLNKK